MWIDQSQPGQQLHFAVSFGDTSAVLTLRGSLDMLMKLTGDLDLASPPREHSA